MERVEPGFRGTHETCINLIEWMAMAGGGNNLMDRSKGFAVSSPIRQ
jgi:hypothetical protein